MASGGVVYLLNGAVLGGHLQLSEGAVMSAYEGSVIDFDLGEANNMTALVNDLSVIAGAPSYTITVPAEIAEGEYLLANGAADFAGTITVKDDTMRYGTLSVENPLVHGWNTYALNLNNGSLSLTVARNDVYHEAEQNEPEEIIVSSGAEIPSGETLVWENTGDIVRITSGAVLRDVEIPWGGTLILEEGAILQGTVRLGTDVRANGIVNATDANLELDISKRKEEYGILLDNLAFVTAAALSVIVDPDQNKGEYILAGNAQEFDGVLTVKSTDGMNRGTISEEQETLDYDITRYILTKNEKNELVFIVSSNIPDETDYILLYKNGRLVLAEESEYELTLSGQNEFDQMIVLANGCAEQITLGSGGLLTVKAGGRAAGVRQAEGGSLRFDYAEGDTTVIDGFNQGGAFFVGNNVLENVRGENVTVTGNVSVRDYGGSGRFEARDGVSITGALHSEELVLSDVTMEGVSVSTDHASFHSGNRIDHCRLDGRGTINVMSEETYNYWFYGGTNVSNSVFTAPTVLCSGASVSDSVFKSYVSLLGGTLSNVAFDLADYQTARFKVMGHVTCEGDLLFTKQPEYWGGFFDMNGHSAIMDYTGREDRDEAMIRRDAFSEDTVFQLNLNEDQVIGTYAIATGAAQGIIDTYHISVNGSIIGTIDGNNREFENGNYSYAMSSEKDGNIFLTVDISDDAEESYSVVWYDADRTIRHSAVASELTIGTDAFPLALVRNNGALNNATLGSGGVLKVKKGGRVAGLRQEEGGSLRFDYAEGDTTVIDGFN
ncbi:MAG: hypothetical protein IKS34_04185, partial [Clostridia bacterium]|nr:hypothetical protein [Clostridia bacterium]